MNRYRAGSMTNNTGNVALLSERTPLQGPKTTCLACGPFEASDRLIKEILLKQDDLITWVWSSMLRLAGWSRIFWLCAGRDMGSLSSTVPRIRFSTVPPDIEIHCSILSLIKFRIHLPLCPSLLFFEWQAPQINTQEGFFLDNGRPLHRHSIFNSGDKRQGQTSGRPGLFEGHAAGPGRYRRPEKRDRAQLQAGAGTYGPFPGSLGIPPTPTHHGFCCIPLQETADAARYLQVQVASLQRGFNSLADAVIEELEAVREESGNWPRERSKWIDAMKLLRDEMQEKLDDMHRRVFV